MPFLQRFVRAVPALRAVCRRLSTFLAYHSVADEAFLTKMFQGKMGKPPDLLHPRSFSEKLQWLKLHWREPKAVQCADECEAREFVASRIGASHLIEMYGVYRRAKEIDLDALPKSFVLKATHGSGWNFFCKDKDAVDWQEVFAKVWDWLHTNCYYLGREWAYRDIPPRIICEKYLFTDAGESPWDYKFFCFNGKPAIIQVDLGRFTDHRRNMYDAQWKRMPFTLEYPAAPCEVERPKTLEKMLEIAARLSQGFPFMRVDLYEFGSEVFFGEMTFYPGGGWELFDPPEYDERLGELLQLPEAAHTRA